MKMTEGELYDNLNRCPPHSRDFSHELGGHVFFEQAKFFCEQMAKHMV